MTDRYDVRAELERHHHAAFGWALSCCRWDRQEAEDMLHEAYVKVLDGRARFAGRASFKTWLFGVIRRTASAQRRRRALRRFVTLERIAATRAVADPSRGPADQVARSDETARLLRALARLPLRQQQVLHLVFYQDLSIAQAAEVLGIGVGSARTHYERGKHRLRTLLTGPDASHD